MVRMHLVHDKLSHVSDLPEFIDVSEWAERVGISRASAYRAVRRGEIPGAFSVGTRIRINWTTWLRVTGAIEQAG